MTVSSNNGVSPSTAPQNTNLDRAGGDVSPKNASSPQRNVNGLVVDKSKNYGKAGKDMGGDPPPPGADLFKVDPSMIMTIISEVFNKLDDTQQAAFLKQLKSEEPRLKDILNAKLKQIQTQFEKQQELQKKQKENQIVSDVQLGLGVALTVFGFMAAILTAGALSGFAIAGMAISGTMTALDVTNRGLRAADINYTDPNDNKTKKPLDVSIGGLVTMAMKYDSASHDYFYPESVKNGSAKDKEDYRQKSILAANVIVSISIAAISIGLGVGAIKAAQKMGDVAKDAGKIIRNVSAKVADFASEHSATIQMAAQGLDIGGEIVNLASSAYQSGNTILMANTNFDMKMAEAHLNQLDGYYNSKRMDINLIQSTMKNVKSNITEGKNKIIDSVAMLNANQSAMIFIS